MTLPVEKGNETARLHDLQYKTACTREYHMDILCGYIDRAFFEINEDFVPVFDSLPVGFHGGEPDVDGVPEKIPVEAFGDDGFNAAMPDHQGGMLTGGAGAEIGPGDDHIAFCDGPPKTGPQVCEKIGKKIVEAGGLRYGGAWDDAVGVDVVLVEDMGPSLDGHRPYLHPDSVKGVITPDTAESAAVTGETIWTFAFLLPILPETFRLVVERAVSPSASRPP
jgi:hypothetical protein